MSADLIILIPTCIHNKLGSLHVQSYSLFILSAKAAWPAQFLVLAHYVKPAKAPVRLMPKDSLDSKRETHGRSSVCYVNMIRMFKVPFTP